MVLKTDNLHQYDKGSLSEYWNVECMAKWHISWHYTQTWMCQDSRVQFQGWSHKGAYQALSGSTFLSWVSLLLAVYATLFIVSCSLCQLSHFLHRHLLPNWSRLFSFLCFSTLLFLLASCFFYLPLILLRLVQEDFTTHPENSLPSQ